MSDKNLEAAVEQFSQDHQLNLVDLTKSLEGSQGCPMVNGFNQLPRVDFIKGTELIAALNAEDRQRDASTPEIKIGSWLNSRDSPNAVQRASAWLLEYTGGVNPAWTEQHANDYVSIANVNGGAMAATFKITSGERSDFACTNISHPEPGVTIERKEEH